MEVVAATPGSGGVPPFHDHDVQEWSRLDSLTGVLERARLETDHWTANTNLSSHKYGKVVDSRARTNADGALQQQARRQLEVFHSQVPGAQFQLIKTHTVSTSRWSNSTSNGQLQDFENLQLAVNPLDVSSQKSKASVGRSFGRRPPTRSRLHDDLPPHIPMSNPFRDSHLTAATNLHRVSRLCHQIHETAVKQAFGRYTNNIKLPIHERQSGDGSVKIQEIESSVSSSNDNERTIVNGHSSLHRTKSTSSEDLCISDVEKSDKNEQDLDDLEQVQNWRRTSKVRRSLQFPKQNRSPPNKHIDLPETSVSVRKIREELEKGRKITAALKTNNIDLDPFDQILQSISSSSSMQSDNIPVRKDDCNEEEPCQVYAKKEKRDSFVTAESLQEIKGKLRRTNSLTTDPHKPNHEEDADDGLGSEDSNIQIKHTNNDSLAESLPLQVSKVRSYIFGMETMLNKKGYSGTGSLESKKQSTNNTTNRNEDWYNRRKSYGFENVQNHDENSSSTLMQSKKQVESSTDSGIWRSSEMFAVPNVTKTKISNDICNNGVFNNKPLSNVRKMTSLFDQRSSLLDKSPQDELTSVWNKVLTNKNDWEKNGINSTTITIPVGSKTNAQSSWNSEPEKEMKRHSIAVDESKYVTKSGDNNYRRTSLAVNSSSDNFDDDNSNNKKNRRVEFCKTEVHFAADSGKVNIVETDGKPPPTNNFRRRRRNSGSLGPFHNEISNLSLLHFGDTSYEKSLLGINNKENVPEVSCNNSNNNDIVYENLKPQNEVVSPIVTVNTNVTYLDYQDENKNSRENSENENRKGILKNKPIKPKPYHLGENGIPFSISSDEDNRKWGVKLKPIDRNDPPIWKSTVTVQNTYFDKPQDNTHHITQNNHSDNISQETEFQKLLKNLKPVSVRTSESFSDHDYKDQYSSMPETFTVRDNRRSSWSVADKNKVPADTQWTENKGYSTKVNFGNGEATVVENRHPTWPRSEEAYRDNKLPSIKPSNQINGRKPSPRINVNSENTRTKLTDNSESFSNNSKVKASPRFTRKSNIHVEAQARRHLGTQPLSSPSLVSSNFDILSHEKPERLQRSPERLQMSPEKLQRSPERRQISSEKHQRSPERLQRSPERLQRTPERVQRSPERLRRSPERLQRSPERLQRSPERLQRSPERLRKSPERLRGSPERLRKSNNEETAKNRLSPSKEFKTLNDTNCINSKVVLRQPKQSEMTYFGVNVSPKPGKKMPEAMILRESKQSEKPDIFHHHQRHVESRKKKSVKQSSGHASPDKSKRPESPIYENIKYKSHTREFDSAILEELTKAADQILQAVNGYTDEEINSRFNTDDDDDKQLRKSPLATISETTAPKQAKKIKTKTAKTQSHLKSKIKPTSSNSSIESVSRENTRILSPTQKSVVTKTEIERSSRKKTASSDVNMKANTRARRLQRATSREALLQSHGSSSEDMTTSVEVPLRKPRLVKKTKTAQLTMTSGPEMKKKECTLPEKRKPEKTKQCERVVGNLPEIRHRTAVSTIRSTAEKVNRERSKERVSKAKTEEQKKRTPQKKDISRGSGSTPKHDRIKPVPSKEAQSHRTSTANIKKCHRAEAVIKH